MPDYDQSVLVGEVEKKISEKMTDVSALPRTIGVRCTKSTYSQSSKWHAYTNFTFRQELIIYFFDSVDGPRRKGRNARSL